MKAQQGDSSGRRGFLFTFLGGAAAAVAGLIAGFFARQSDVDLEEARIAAVEAKAAELSAQLARSDQPSRSAAGEPIGYLEGPRGERVIFEKSELSLINPAGVLLNLVAANGHVGIRFYKDFSFGNEQVTSPWHMGFIEGKPGYEGLAILRDWRFTAALWDGDGKLIVGRLDPHPPANEPAKARFEVRGAVDETQALVMASKGQTVETFRIVGRSGTNDLAVNGQGDLVVGAPDGPTRVILHDTDDGAAYALSVASGRLTLNRI